MYDMFKLNQESKSNTRFAGAQPKQGIWTGVQKTAKKKGRKHSQSPRRWFKFDSQIAKNLGITPGDSVKFDFHISCETGEYPQLNGKAGYICRFFKDTEGFRVCKQSSTVSNHAAKQFMIAQFEGSPMPENEGVVDMIVLNDGSADKTAVVFFWPAYQEVAVTDSLKDGPQFYG